MGGTGLGLKADDFDPRGNIGNAWVESTMDDPRFHSFRLGRWEELRR